MILSSVMDSTNNKLSPKLTHNPKPLNAYALVFQMFTVYKHMSIPLTQWLVEHMDQCRGFLSHEQAIPVVCATTMCSHN